MATIGDVAGCSDPVILNEWHAISALEEIVLGVVGETVLLDERVGYTMFEDSACFAWRSTPDLTLGGPVDAVAIRDPLPVRSQYGYLWTSLGSPATELFSIPEFDDAERRNVHAGSPMLATSAARAVENFLDIAHLAFVHQGILGEQPHTEVSDYDVNLVDDEIIATKCDFYIPKVGPNFDAGIIRYRYRVPRPFCVMLYWDSYDDPSREDVIGMWVQPMRQEQVRAHRYLGTIDRTSTDNEIRHHQLLILGQDKPIVENQRPKRLPLHPQAETPIRADKSAIAYRRWLSEKGVTYGVIPALT